MKPAEILALGPWLPHAKARLQSTFSAYTARDISETVALPSDVLASIRGVAGGSHTKIGRAIFDALPKLEIIACFGVGYDGVDVDAARENAVIVTNTPGVLTEEVADTALGLLLMTIRQFPAAERYLRSGEWQRSGDYRLTSTLRNRTVGIVGFGRIGGAVARRLDAMQVPVCYHNRHEKSGSRYRYYSDLIAMARDVDTLICILPGGAATKHLIDASVLAALGPQGVLINIGRGSTVDESALINALQQRAIHAAGLDVFEKEPDVPARLIDLDNAVLLPHVGSATQVTRDAMEALVIDNLVSWFDADHPITPVSETPWPRPIS